MSNSNQERSPAALTQNASLVASVPHISFRKAQQKVLKGYKTIGTRPVRGAELEIFLCTPTGLPVAIVDFDETDGEVRR